MKIYFLLIILFLIDNINNKKFNYCFININNYSNYFWNYVDILNNNNRSVLFFIILNTMVINFINNGFYKNYKKIWNVIILFFFNYSINILLKKSIFFVKKFKIININLINGLIIIHPVFMYLTYSFFINLKIITNCFKKKINFCILKLNNISKKLITFSFISLILGCYWAQQEINWGGWWNWDFVEMVSFIFFLKSIFLVHTNLNKNLNFIKNILINSFINIFLFFLLIRIDILNSIHSFNSLNDLGLNINIIILIYIYLFIFLIFYKKIKNMNKYIYINKNLLVLNLNSILINFLLIYIYYNIFISYYYNIQLIELTKFLKNILLYFFIIYIYIVLINFKKNLNFFFMLIFILTLCFVNFKFYIYLLILVFLNYLIYILNNLKINFKNLYHIYIFVLILFIILKTNIYIINYYIHLNYIKYNLNVYNNYNISSKNVFSTFFDDILIDKNLNNYSSYNSNFFFFKHFNEILVSSSFLYKNSMYIIYNIDNRYIFVNYFNINIFLFSYFYIIAISIFYKFLLNYIRKSIF